MCYDAAAAVAALPAGGEAPGPPRPAAGHRVAYLCRLTGASARVECPRLRAELPARMAPPASLDAGYRDRHRRCRRHQDREVEDAILLGSDQLLAVDQKNAQPPFVLEPKFGHGSGFGDFHDLGLAIGQCLVEGAIVGLPVPVGAQERRHFQSTELH